MLRRLGTFQKVCFGTGNKLLMPALSPTMTSGNIAKWRVKAGDAIKEGDTIADVEDGRSTLPLKAVGKGVVAQIVASEGAKGVAVGAVIGYTVDSPEELAGFTSPAKNYPPHRLVGLPALSPTMSSGSIASYDVKEGSAVSQGDVICSIETDKATMAFEYQDEGYVAKILVPAGARDVPINTPLIITVKKKEHVEAFKDFVVQSETSSQTTTPKTVDEVPQPASARVQPVETANSKEEKKTERVPASPAARQALAKGGVDWRENRRAGSGPAGRVLLQDVPDLLNSENPPPPIARADFEEIPLSPMRRVIAERLLHSKRTIPHYYVSMDVRMDALLSLKKQIADQSGTRVSVTDLMLRAIGLAASEVPEANSQLEGEKLRRFPDCDVSLAVDIGDGLITPIIRATNRKSVTAIAREATDLIARAKARKLAPNEYQGGTFSLSNLGMMGVSSFAAVINPPQACILAIGKTEKRAMFDASAPQNLRWDETLTATLSADHRVVDGAAAARWMQAFKKYVENPFLMLL